MTLDDIVRLLAVAADRPVEAHEPGRGIVALGHSQLDHALQTAALLRLAAPGDDELVAAGLLHDIGHLLPGSTDADHARAGAAVVRGALGERVAALVGLHVEAKRYLVAREGTYAGALAADSVASLLTQGGPMSAGEQAAFAALPLADDALVLRRADESAKVEGLEVPGLTEWLPTLHRLHDRHQP